MAPSNRTMIGRYGPEVISSVTDTVADLGRLDEYSGGLGGAGDSQTSVFLLFEAADLN